MRRLLVTALLPSITRWIEARERQIFAEGTPLDERGTADALTVGVAHPYQVRLLRVPQVPLPDAPLIHLAERLGGGPWRNTAGLTARYGIFIREIYWAIDASSRTSWRTPRSTNGSAASLPSCGCISRSA